MKTKIFFYLSTFLFSCTLALLGASSAYATSSVDDVITTVPSLPLKNPLCEEKDITTNWLSILKGIQPGDGEITGNLSSYYDDIDTALETGSYAVTLYDFGGDNTNVFVAINNDNEFDATFVLSGGDYYLRVPSSSLGFIIYQNNDCKYDISYGGSYTIDIAVSDDSGIGYKINPFLVAYPIDYPDGYEGQIPPDTITPPENNDTTPNWYVSQSIDYKASIHDTNFNTFDGNPFLCGEDLAPVIRYEIIQDYDSTVLTSGVQSATAQIDYQFPKVDVDRQYNITGYYECFEGDNITFTDTSTFSFTITRQGLLKNDMFTECFLPDFPFVDMNGCLNNIYTVINLLSFNTVGFNNNWRSSPSCYNLTVLDDWLHLPNPQVCPQFPSTVRNIITPFVLLMLGIVTIGFIAKKTGSEF